MAKLNGLFESNAQTTADTQKALRPKLSGTLNQSLTPALVGLQAGQGFTATDPTEAAVGILGATATGALSGALVGGPVCALIGSGTGFL